MYFDRSELTQNNCKKKVPRKQKQKKKKKNNILTYFILKSINLFFVIEIKLNPSLKNINLFAFSN